MRRGEASPQSLAGHRFGGDASPLQRGLPQPGNAPTLRVYGLSSRYTGPTMPISLCLIGGESAITFGNDAIECRLDLRPTPRLSSLLNKHTGDTCAVASSECSVWLASGGWRADIAEWRFCPGSGDATPFDQDLGFRNGFHLPDTDASAWANTQQLNGFPIGPPGYSAVTYPGYGWYRHTFELPADLDGQSIEFGLGGCDNQDWLEYRVYVNGAPIGHAQTAGHWHDAPRFQLHPGDAAYGALRFGARNVLAVQTRGLDRSTPAMSMPDAERYSVGSPLVDQYVAAAPALVEVSASQFIGYRPVQTSDTVGIDLDLTDDAGDLRFTVHYWVNVAEPVLHKRVDVRNTGAAPVTLLEMDVHRLTCDQPISTGGLGLPCTIGDDLFCGIRHPAGLAQGQDGELRLRLFPGQVLAPGECYESKVAVFGAGPAGEARQSFLRYLENHSPRSKAPRWISLYDVYGWHDIAGIDNPTPVTDELVQRSLDVLAEFQQRGITFDYYDIDTGWNNPTGDLRDFDPHNFPSGPARIVERVRQMGMKFGLWVSPAAGPMAFHPDALNPALALGGTLPGEPVEDGATERLRGMLCMASEPWRGMFREALLHHVRAHDVRNYKLDANAFFCTNRDPSHHHLPGKYAIEPIMDAMIDTLNAVRRECPDILFMYYWGISSPWWLLYGDTIYERGVLMEGATPSDFPSPLMRQSVTLSFDQAAHHAWDSVPLSSHDSLGVWISDTRWGNWMGREGWQDAWIMDIARGSGLTQLWGDISQFDEQDVRFLANVSAWLRANASALIAPRRIGGDPWRAQPYGYSYADGQRAIVFAYNPQYRAATMALRPADLGLISANQEVKLDLQPFEVKWLQIDGATGRIIDVLREVRGEAGPRVETRQLDCHLREVARHELRWDDADPQTKWALRRAVNGRAQYVDTDEAFQRAHLRSDERDRRIGRREWAGEMDVPASKGNEPSAMALDIVVRLSRDGIFWHHHALFDIIRLSAEIEGRAMAATVTPNRWHEQAGGWSWITFHLPLQAHPLPAQVQLRLSACVPESVDARVEAWMWVERWDELTRLGKLLAKTWPANQSSADVLSEMRR